MSWLSRRQLKNLEFAPHSLYKPLCCLYNFRIVWACQRFFSGPQVFSMEEYHFQDTRYIRQPGDPLCERISAISYSSSPSISSGGGFMKFSLCLAVSQ